MPEVPLIVEVDAKDPQCAMVSVDGLVADRAYRFVLDTGASRTQVVADEFIDALATTGEHRSHGVFSHQHARTVLLEDVVVGPIRRASLEASVASGSDESVHGLIGMDLLQNHRLHFVFDRGVLVVDETPVDVDLQTLEVDDGCHLYLEATWPNAAATCVWDSGAGMTVIDQKFWSDHEDLFGVVGTSTGTDATGVQEAAPTFEISTMLIGRRRFAPHHVAVVDLSAANSSLAKPMDIILGYPTLRQANWYFDVPQRLWGITHCASEWQ